MTPYVRDKTLMFVDRVDKVNPRNAIRDPAIDTDLQLNLFTSEPATGAKRIKTES